MEGDLVSPQKDPSKTDEGDVDEDHEDEESNDGEESESSDDSSEESEKDLDGADDDVDSTPKGITKRPKMKSAKAFFYNQFKYAIMEPAFGEFELDSINSIKSKDFMQTSPA